MNKKQKVKKELKFYGRKATTAFVIAIVFVTVAGTSIWAIAAFTEPTTTPGNSVQDFAKNIMGANNIDNAFDSSSVTANSGGSMIERLENLENKQNVTAISAEGPSQNVANAAKYCFDLSATAEAANTGSDTSTTYTDWRLGTVGELSIFMGTITDTSDVWTATLYDADDDDWFKLNLYNGTWSHHSFHYSNYVRCIR